MTTVLLALSQELARKGIAVDLISRASGSASVTTLGPSITLRELPAGPAEVWPKNRLPEVMDDFGEALGVLARREAYDLIHAHYWLSGVAALPVALELGLPLVQSFHTLAAMKESTAAGGQPLEPERRLVSERYLATQADAIIAGSAAEAATLVGAVGAPAERTWVIPPGVDVDLFRPDRISADAAVRRELHIADGPPILAVVGRLQTLKNQELAVRALAELDRLGGTPGVLVIAGEPTPGDDGYLRMLHGLAVELGVEDRVRFVGALRRNALADLFAVASVTLVPSRSETFGLVALESAASGTPVVGFRGTGLVESVADGRSGLLTDSWDPHQWARAIAELLEDAQRERYSKSARLHALGFTWPASAAALIAVYSSLLA
ncbi:glycosyltransferase [Parafrigoribacterium mesophilum]|uniref:glycosyltransferase n=1 Tax=Parafrigoribacterium mesophilum TaxID=433646 RepID=UPI0031FE23D9